MSDNERKLCWLAVSTQVRQQDALLKHHATTAVSGVELLHQLEHAVRIVPTGCAPIDALLRGGLREGHHTEVVGGAGSGKSQLCMCAAMLTASRGERVVFIDCCGDFSGSRCAQLHASLAASCEGVRGGVADAMAHVSVWRVHDAHTLLRVLDNLAADLQALQAQHSAAESMPRALIIDGLSMLLVPTMSAPRSTSYTQGCVMMTSVARMLRCIASSYRLVLLTTNHSVRGNEGDSKAALGEIWKNQPHLRLRLTSNDGDSSIKLATITQSTICACGESAQFQITAAGLVEPPTDSPMSAAAKRQKRLDEEYE